MDVRNLSAFVEVVRQGGFSRASKTLHLSQSAVSKAVKAIEEELGQPLLARLGRKVTLTDAGRVVLDRAQSILTGLHTIQEEVAEVGAVRRGHLRLGIPPMVGGAFFPPVLGDFRAAFPGVTLELREVGARSVEALVLAGEIEAGATVLPTDRSTFEAVPLMRDVLRAVVHPRSPLARRRSVALRDLESVPFVLYREDFALQAHPRRLPARGVPPEGRGRELAVGLHGGDGGGRRRRRPVAAHHLPAARRGAGEGAAARRSGVRWDLALIWKRGRHLPRPHARSSRWSGGTRRPGRR
jgi:DNA-binding transcriptional LysR family regulator